MAQEIFIRRPSQQENTYRVLQETSIGMLQRLSGKIWTDFNVHDPGVTLLEALNLALSEFDYRLNFPLPDYLSIPEKNLRTEKYGLFNAQDVFTTAPITSADYRMLLISSIELVENAWVSPSREEGLPAGFYDILAELSPTAPQLCEESVHKSILELFHRNRNLCEHIARVRFVHRTPLKLVARIEIEPGADTTGLSADIYWEALHFFTCSTPYRPLEKQVREGMPWDEIFDGPTLGKCSVDRDALAQAPTCYHTGELYTRIKNLKGVKNILRLYFEGHGEEITVDDPAESFTVTVPKNEQETGVRLSCEGALLSPDIPKIAKRLFARSARTYGSQHQSNGGTLLRPYNDGKHRDIYTHRSIRHDFPEFYGVGSRGAGSDATPLQKMQGESFRAYLLLFDLMLSGGLSEVQAIASLMSLEGAGVPEPPLSCLSGAVDTDITDRNVLGQALQRTQKDIIAVRHSYLDMLDRIYGEDSLPAFIREDHPYGRSEQEQLERRISYLQRVPALARDRFKAMNLFPAPGDDPAGNLPGLKVCLLSLLGLPVEAERPVMNVFPQNGLKVVDQSTFRAYYADFQATLSPDLHQKGISQREISKKPIEDTEESLRDLLPFFSLCMIPEELLRGGCAPENLKVVPQGDVQENCRLVFQDGKDPGSQEWTLGNFRSPAQAQKTAGKLRKQLIRLNRSCETLYVVEHIALWPFTEQEKRELLQGMALTVVLPGFTARMHRPGFRRACEDFILQRLPAHIDVQIAWLSPPQMYAFEKAYFGWRNARNASSEKARNAASELKAVLADIRKNNQ